LLPAVAAAGWVFLTQDARIRYRSAEANALREAELRTFVFVTANLSTERTVEILEKARRLIERVAANEDAPFIYRVGKDGSVKRVG
jgi:PIN like domain